MAGTRKMQEEVPLTALFNFSDKNPFVPHKEVIVPHKEAVYAHKEAFAPHKEAHFVSKGVSLPCKKT